METPPTNQNEEKLRPLPDSFFKAKDDFYMGNEGSKRDFKWQKYFSDHTGVMDFFSKNKSDMAVPYRGKSFVMYQKLAAKSKISEPPNRCREELRESLKHHVFTAAMMLQRKPISSPITRWEIEDIAQKLKAQDELHSRGNSTIATVFNLTKNEKNILNLEVARLNKEGKLRFSRRLWRETGLSSVR